MFSRNCGSQHGGTFHSASGYRVAATHLGIKGQVFTAVLGMSGWLGALQLFSLSPCPTQSRSWGIMFHERPIFKKYDSYLVI